MHLESDISTATQGRSCSPVGERKHHHNERLHHALALTVVYGATQRVHPSMCFQLSVLLYALTHFAFIGPSSLRHCLPPSRTAYMLRWDPIVYFVLTHTANQQRVKFPNFENIQLCLAKVPTRPFASTYIYVVPSLSPGSFDRDLVSF